MQERKCFVCRCFGHIVHNCRNMENGREERSILILLNKFKILRSKVMNIEKCGGRKISKDRKTILREEKLKREKSVEVWKTRVENNSNRVENKLLRKVIVKIGLKQEYDEEGIAMEALLDSGTTGLVMSSEFARKNKFKKKKLERLIYMRNIDNMS